MDPKDFTLISDKLGERLTKSEFVAYCDNPLRMPRMLSIRNYASDKSHEEEKKIGPALPEEAYKHILWAYLLCKAYDDKFSREVTDGHEKDAVGRTELSVRTYLSAERGQSEPWERAMGTKEETEIQMDLINNSIGRGYYRKGYKERDLLQHTMKDPAVIRWHMDLAAGRKDAGKAPVD
jgi:hypothetical protein